MSNPAKKRAKLQDQIERLENQLKGSLRQKSNGTAEVSLLDINRKIAKLREELRKI